MEQEENVRVGMPWHSLPKGAVPALGSLELFQENTTQDIL